MFIDKKKIITLKACSIFGLVLMWLASTFFLQQASAASLSAEQIHSAKALAKKPIPRFDNQQRVGTKTCGQGECHAASEPWLGSPIAQVEYLQWRQHDKHAQAYKALLSKKGKSIAKKLGIKNPANASLCLGCHTDYISKSQRLELFSLKDGVGCEACHGGARKWLGKHSDGDSLRADHIQNGMFPTENPAARAKLCFSCHMAGLEQGYNHKLDSAGHPRLKFELDTYTFSQPAHFVNDQDYRQRKRPFDSATTWALGQLYAAQKQLENINHGLNQQGMFPDWAIYDCHNCHRSMQKKYIKPQAAVLGKPVLNDVHLLMARIVVGLRSLSQSKKIDGLLQKLHSDSAQSAQQFSALTTLFEKYTNSYLQQGLTTKEIVRAIQIMAEEAQNNKFAAYINAEQLVMAVAGLVEELRSRDYYSKAKYLSISQELEHAYQATNNLEEYAFMRVVKAITAIGKIHKI